MQVFKLCLCKIARNPLFFVIYVVGLSFMGLAMAAGLTSSLSLERFERQPTQFAVIDRDDSELSRGVVAYLETQGVRQPVEDSGIGLQDAVAKGEVEYILIILEGYGQAFAEAVEAGAAPEPLESVYSFDAATGVLVDQRVNNYINIVFDLAVAQSAAGSVGRTETVGGHVDAAAGAGVAAGSGVGESAGGGEGSVAEADGAGAESAVSWGLLANEALKVADTKVQASYMDAGAHSDGAQFLFYLEWSMYGLFAGVVVSVCGLNGSLSQTDLRRRNAVAPLTQASYNVQVALACLVIGVAAWAWDFGIGYVVFHGSASTLSALALAGLACAMFAFMLLALSVGFLLSKVRCSIAAANAAGNIGGLVLSFMGGAWVPLSVMSAEMIAIAHFLPGYWYTVACEQAAAIPAGLPMQELVSQLGPVAWSLGVMLLFALAFFLVALVVGKVRVRD